MTPNDPRPNDPGPNDPGPGGRFGMAPQQRQPATNGLAVASLILGLAWLCGLGSLAAVITGHISLSQIKKTGSGGRGMAVAGLALGYVGIVTCLIVGAVFLAVAGDDTTAERLRSIVPTSPGPGSGPQATRSARPTGPRTFGDGTFAVGREIRPGRYRTEGGGDVGICYLARLRGPNSEDPRSIIANDMVDGRAYLTVKSTDKYVQFTGGCEWTRQ